MGEGRCGARPPPPRPHHLQQPHRLTSGSRPAAEAGAPARARPRRGPLL